MAFNTAEGRAEYTASGGQVLFTFTFKIYTTADILVYLTPAGQTYDDTADLLTLTTDYTVVINGDNGGDLTLVAAASAGDRITIVRDLAIDRTTDYQTGGDLAADTLDADQDYQTYLVGDRKLQIDRCLQLPKSVQGTSTTLPPPTPLNVMRWNAAGAALENSPIAADSVFVNILNVDAMSDLIGVTNTDSETINVRGYYTINDGGGGIFNWDATANKNTANGGTVIDPSVSLALQGTGVGVGCWVRQYSGAINPLWFGADRTGATDNSTVFQKLETLSELDYDFDFVEGIYSSSYPLTLLGNNNVRAIGRVEITQPDTAGNMAVQFGYYENFDPDLNGSALAATSANGTSTITLASGQGANFTDGDQAYIYSGTCDSSSGSNRIPINKEYVDIIDVTGDVVTIKQKLLYEYNLADAPYLLRPDKFKPWSGKFEGFILSNNTTTTTSYLHEVKCSRGGIIKNVRFDGYSAVGAATFSEGLRYDNIEMTGYNGISQGRGIISAEWDNVIFRERTTSAEGVGIFLEEHPTFVKVTNSHINSCAVITSSLPDTSITSTVNAQPKIIVDNTVIKPVVTTRHPFLCGSIYSTTGYDYPVTISNCKIHGVGYDDLSGVGTTVLKGQFMDNIEVYNTVFPDCPLTSTPIAFSNVGTVKLKTYGNDYGAATSISNYDSYTDSLEPTTEIAEATTALNSNTRGTRKVFKNTFGGASSYSSIFSANDDANGGKAGFGVNGYCATQYSTAITPENAAYCSWATFGYSLTSAFESVATYNLVKRNVAGTTTVVSTYDFSGNFFAGTDNTQTLGSATNRWSEVFAGNGTINTSDDREKTYLDITSSERTAALEIKANLKKFKFNDAISSKGVEKARIHFGASAQTIKAIMEKHGLDPFAYGMLCFDSWDEIPEKVDDKGIVVQEYVPAGDRYGVRYDELSMFILSSI